MKTTYRMEMSDGKIINVTEMSAGAAVMAALKKMPGRTVTHCRSGLTDVEAKELRRNGISTVAMAGYIVHEIPEHRALTMEEALAKPASRRLPDQTVSMFDEEEIKADSKKAKNNFYQRSVFSADAR